MAKKKENTPRRKRFKKEQRLQNAKIKWLPTVTAENIAKSYSKWYGVGLLTAIRELEILGHVFTEHYKEQVKISIERKATQKRIQKEKKEEERVGALFGYDDHFSFIAGYTENGVPFGTTWEEEEEDY